MQGIFRCKNGEQANDLRNNWIQFVNEINIYPTSNCMHTYYMFIQTEVLPWK